MFNTPALDLSNARHLIKSGIPAGFAEFDRRFGSLGQRAQPILVYHHGQWAKAADRQPQQRAATLGEGPQMDGFDARKPRDVVADQIDRRISQPIADQQGVGGRQSQAASAPLHDQSNFVPGDADADVGGSDLGHVPPFSTKKGAA